MTSTPTPKTIALGLAATLAIGAGGVSVAGAADSASSTTSTPAKTAKGPTPEQRAANKAARQAEFAKALGVSVADVQKARETVKDAAQAKHAAKEQERAQAKGLTVQQLRDQRADKAAKRFAKAVKNDRMTKAQAAAIVSTIRKGEPVRPLLKKIRAEHRKDVKQQRAAKRADRRSAKG